MEKLLDTRPVVSGIAPSVVAVSTFMGVQRKVDCSGLVIGWNETEGEALILTSAKLVRIPEDVQETVFQVFVRLANSKVFLARLHFVDFHHNLAILKIKCRNERIRAASIDNFGGKGVGLVDETGVVAVGRDFLTGNLLSGAGSFSFSSDYPFFGCQLLTSSSCSINKVCQGVNFSDQVCEGGPLVDYSGRVVGINFAGGLWTGYTSPLLSVFFIERLKMSEKKTITLPSHILEKLEILGAPKNSVLVKEVFDGSSAKNSGVVPGDIVVSFANMPAGSVKQYCNLLHLITRAGPDMKPIPICIQKRDSSVITVWGEVLPVSDRKFCCCWPLRERFWYQQPLYGSQTDPNQKSDINPNNKHVKQELLSPFCNNLRKPMM